MVRTKDLQAFKAVVGFAERDPKVRAKPKVGPKLQTGFQPFHLGPQLEVAYRWGGDGVGWIDQHGAVAVLEEHGLIASAKAGGRRPEPPEGAEGLGLSMARNSRRPRRHGLDGLTAVGRHNVSSALVLLEEQRKLLSFWTVTLPGDALRHLAQVDGVPVFINRMLDALRRKLEARLGIALYVGVLELQPERTKREGLPCIHLHVAFKGRKHGRAAWAVTPEELDAFIAEGLRATGFKVTKRLVSAGNVQQVKKSVRAYLAKYMTKGSSDAQVWAHGLWENLIPRQWWCWSVACRQLVESCTSELPTGFMAWVWRDRARLLQEGWFYLQQCVVSAEAPATYRVHWGKVANLAMVMAQWHEHLEDARVMALAELGVLMQMGQLTYAKPLPRLAA